MIHRIFILGALIALLSPPPAHATPKQYPYKAVATVGMITDIVRNVAGDKAQVEGLIGEGVDPHLYKPTRRDLIALRQADIIFYNGLMLEGKMADVLTKIAREKPVYAVTEGIQELPVIDVEALQDQLEVQNAIYQAMMERLQKEMTPVALREPNARIVDMASPSIVKGENNVYLSTATVQVLLQEPNTLDGATTLPVMQGIPESPALTSVVIDRLSPEDQAILVKPYSGMSIDAVLTKNLQIKQIQETWLLTFFYAHPDDPQLAAKIANYYANEYVNYVTQTNIKSAMYAVEDLRKRTEHQRKKVTEVRAKLKQAESDDYVLTDEEDHYDPHVWMDVRGWIQATKVVEKALAEFDPKNADYYQENAQTYIAQLEQLDAYAREVLASIPEGQRYLVTAHDAFNYLGRAYGIEVRGIQGLSTESEAGVRDIEQLVDFLVQNQIPAVFVETSVSDKNVRALIEGAAARGHTLVIGGSLYSDAMGAPGSYEGTYIGMIDHNTTTIARALGGQAPEKGLNGKLTGAH